jgi:uracil-DNA glycosylase
MSSDSSTLLRTRLPADWATALGERLDRAAVERLFEFERAERARAVVFPPEPLVFSAFFATPLARVRVVLLGQDPYHGEGQAHGLAFSVLPGVALPPSLANLFRELASDLSCEPPTEGTLTGWATQGVLLLNAVLTVRSGEANAHAKHGWEALTDAAVAAVDARATPAVFLLLGAAAQKKAARVDRARHRVIELPHPSPLSAHRGFFGSRPYSRVNRALAELGLGEVDWSKTLT